MKKMKAFEEAKLTIESVRENMEKFQQRKRETRDLLLKTADKIERVLYCTVLCVL